MFWLGYMFLQGQIPEVLHKIGGSQAMYVLCVPICNMLYVVGNTFLQEQNEGGPQGSRCGTAIFRLFLFCKTVMRNIVSWQNVNNVHMLTSPSNAIPLRCLLSTPICTDRLLQHTTMHGQNYKAGEQVTTR